MSKLDRLGDAPTGDHKGLDRGRETKIMNTTPIVSTGNRPVTLPNVPSANLKAISATHSATVVRFPMG